MDAEAWEVFPEMEACYLKFPRKGAVGSLPDFEIEWVTTAASDEDARLLLSGYGVPFTWIEAKPEVETPPTEEFVHEV
jgi:hypothetical protein